jgi:response regulator of citrate/malate metabolism
VTQHPPLSVLIVEDQAIVAMELQFLVEDAGHEVAGWATDLEEAYSLLKKATVDLALVDVHLADGPTGTSLAAYLRDIGVRVVFMTANAKRVPPDFVGAVGILAKPYTANSVKSALTYIHAGVRNPPPRAELPNGFRLSPVFSELWAAG